MSVPARRAQVRIGDVTVTYLPDGFGAHVPEAVFPGVDWTNRPGYLSDDGQVVLSFGSFLVRASGHNILVDLALGDLTADVPGIAHLEGGALLDNLAAEGLTPDDIDTVVFTHMHVDHVGWTSDIAPNPAVATEGVPAGLTFPRARHLLAEAEWSHWAEHNKSMGGPDSVAVLGPLDGVVEFVKDDEQLADGVRVKSTPGHSPGHIAVVIEDTTGAGSAPLMLIGDILHSAAQIPEPALAFSSESDPERARAVREFIVGGPPILIGAGHFTDHAFGRIEQGVGGPVWVPLEATS